MTKPTLTGLDGSAWVLDNKKLDLLAGVPEEHDAIVAFWVVTAPWAHPAWHSYAIITVHLRPMPDGRPTLMYRPDATHEIWVYALNPKKNMDKLVASEDLQIGSYFLTPINYAGQFVAQDDADAYRMTEEAVKDILAMKLSPDTDFRSQWIARFGGEMVKA